MQRKKPKVTQQRSSQFMIDKDALARLAYELYVRRGGEDGHDLEDWVMAEKILIEQQKRQVSHRLELDASRRWEDKFLQ